MTKIMTTLEVPTNQLDTSRWGVRGNYMYMGKVPQRRYTMGFSI